MRHVDDLDSRALRYCDTYGQRFMRSGTFSYHILPAGTAPLTDRRPYRIDVHDAPAGTKMKQHMLVVHHEKDRFWLDTRELNIKVGDLVTWSCREPSAAPMQVIGDKEFFDSSRLRNECGFAHAFGRAGEFEWVDAFGSGLQGVVQVCDPKCQSASDIESWKKQLKTGTVVMINGRKAEPQRVRVLTGQTVYFAVVKGPGISVTDRRIVEVEKACAVQRSTQLGHGHQADC
jgi:plastocyanin